MFIYIEILNLFSDSHYFFNEWSLLPFSKWHIQIKVTLEYWRFVFWSFLHFIFKSSSTLVFIFVNRCRGFRIYLEVENKRITHYYWKIRMAFNLYTTQKVKSSEKLEKSVWPILQNYKNVSVSQNLSISWRFNLFEIHVSVRKYYHLIAQPFTNPGWYANAVATKHGIFFTPSCLLQFTRWRSRWRPSS